MALTAAATSPTLTSLCCSTKPSEKPKELIIPLIQKNRWHRPDQAVQAETRAVKTPKNTEDNDSVESQAVKELIEGIYIELEYTCVYIYCVCAPACWECRGHPNLSH